MSIDAGFFGLYINFDDKSRGDFWSLVHTKGGLEACTVSEFITETLCLGWQGLFGYSKDCRKPKLEDKIYFQGWWRGMYMCDRGAIIQVSLRRVKRDTTTEIGIIEQPEVHGLLKNIWKLANYLNPFWEGQCYIIQEGMYCAPSRRAFWIFRGYHVFMSWNQWSVRTHKIRYFRGLMDWIVISVLPYRGKRIARVSWRSMFCLPPNRERNTACLTVVQNSTVTA